MKYLLFLLFFYCNLLYSSTIETKALHLVIRGNEDILKMKELILYAKNYNFNTIILMLANGVKLDTLPKVHKKDMWSKKKFKELIDYIKDNQLEIIPEIKFLTHQYFLFDNMYPKYMFNKTTYDPNNKKIYKHIFKILDEIIELTNCKVIHIGHDEVAGNHRHLGRKWITVYERLTNKVLTADLYLKDILKIHNYLKHRDIKTMIWGDMLLSPKKFPNMLERNLNGTSNFDLIIDDLPRDIIIGDWHYFDEVNKFPSYQYFINKGFTVYGASWENKITTKNFISYIKRVNSRNKGYIQTTWYNSSFKKYDTIKALIKYSGEVLLNEK